MRHFKDESGNVMAIDQGQEFLIDESWVELSASEYSNFINPPRTNEQVVSDEQAWVISELSIADIEVNKHLDGDARAIATEAAWRAYRCQLRDYVKGGQIVGERPARPI